MKGLIPSLLVCMLLLAVVADARSLSAAKKPKGVAKKAKIQSSSPKCSIGCTSCNTRGKKCERCDSAANFIPSPGASGKCLCAPGWGSYVNKTYDEGNTDLDAYPSIAPNCADLTSVGEGQGTCSCSIQCPEGFTSEAKSPEEAACERIEVDCVGDFVDTAEPAVCSNPCGNGTVIGTYTITTDALYGGDECPYADGYQQPGETECTGTLAENDPCDVADATKVCLSGVCAAPQVP